MAETLGRARLRPRLGGARRRRHRRGLDRRRDLRRRAQRRPGAPSSRVHPEDAGLAAAPARGGRSAARPPRTPARCAALLAGEPSRLPRRRAPQRRRRARRRRARRRPRARASRSRAESIDSGAARAHAPSGSPPSPPPRRRRPMSILDEIRAYKLADVAAPQGRAAAGRHRGRRPRRRPAARLRRRAAARPRPAATG